MGEFPMTGGGKKKDLGNFAEQFCTGGFSQSQNSQLVEKHIPAIAGHTPSNNHLSSP